MKQEKLFDLLKAAVSPCECVKAAKQELLENGFEEIDYTGNWKLVRGHPRDGSCRRSSAG